MDRIEAKILEILDAHAEELQALAQDLFLHPEQGYHEYRTAQVVSDFLKKLGLTTKEGLAITGVKAAIGSGKGPNVALIGELDAVSCPSHPNASQEGYAHACGHYAQLVCMLGAALALSDPEVSASLDGTATIFAVPAEEFQPSSVLEKVRASHDVHCAGGKCELIRRGEFDEVDMAITTHTMMVGRETDTKTDLMLGNSACNGFIGKTVYMHGKASHAAAAPHMGVNALNAACLGMSALGMVRETFEEKDCVRVHPYIREGGEAINVVPSRVVVDMMVRANTQAVIESTSTKVDNCFLGAAMAIGCEAEICNSQGYMPCPERLPDQVMYDAAAALGDNITVSSVPAGICNTASTDVGDLFAIMPVLNFTFGGSTGALHSKDYTVTDPDTAHLLPAKMMALLTYHLLKNGGNEAQAIMKDYKAPYTKEDYKRYTQEISG